MTLKGKFIQNVKRVWFPSMKEGGRAYNQSENPFIWMFLFLLGCAMFGINLLDTLAEMGFITYSPGNKIHGLIVASLLSMIVSVFLLRYLSFTLPALFFTYTHKNKDDHPTLSPIGHFTYWLFVAMGISYHLYPEVFK